MELRQEHPLQRYWDLAAATVRADALDTALELALFEALERPASAMELARRLGLHPANTSHLLDLLWSMGLLRRRETRSPVGPVCTYQAGGNVRRFFLSASPGYCGDAWRYRLRSLRHFGEQLCEHVLNGTGGPDVPYLPPTGKNWAYAAQSPLGQEQRAVTVQAAQEVLARVPEFQAAKRFLDLGGGPGWLAVALAEANPGIQGVVFDGPQTAAIARQNIEQAGLAARLSVWGGDLAEDEFGTGYDLVWCSSVLHFVPDLAMALRKIADALRPGGVFICVHAEIASKREAAARVLPYYLPMMMTGRSVARQGEMAAAIRQAGFTRIDSFEATNFPMASVQVLIGRRSPP